MLRVSLRSGFRFVVAATWIAAAPLTAQGTWTQRVPTQPPTVVSDHAMVYDLLRASTWLLCGATSGGGLLNDTWRYDGTTWTKASPATSPPARLRHAVAFDLLRGKVVLFGGSTATNTGHFADTWEFDGTNWQQLTPANSPTPRNDHAMVYDEARQKVLLFGGHDVSAVFGDTWQWDGTNWTQLNPVTIPTVRRDFGMVYDKARRKVVMFGGFQGQGLGVPLNDTWEWDGTDWTRVTTTTSPSARGGFVMAYDIVRQRTTLFSGYPITADTWNYDGKDWALQTSAATPTGRSGHAMVYDFLRSRLVMAGGYDSAFTNDTWEFSTTAPGAINPIGSGCAGTAGIPALSTTDSALPWVGTTLPLEVAAVPAAAPLTLLIGASKQSWGSIPLPFNLSSLGMTGCTLQTSIDVTVPMANGGGLGTLALPIPVNFGLVGQQLYIQTFVIDIGGNPGNATLSNGLALLFGAL